MCPISSPTRSWTPWCGSTRAFSTSPRRGFKDTTRIAASDPRVWREIFQENRVALGEALGAFRQALDHLDGLVASGDAPAIEGELDRIRRVREGMR